MAADLAGRAMGLAKMVVLARLLAPRDFGLMGLAALVLSWFEFFSQTGFSLALIRKPGDVRPYLNTFFTVQAIRGALLAAGMFAAAPAAAWLFHSPEVVPVIRAISVVAILRGVANPAMVHLRKELKIEQEVIWRTGGALIGLMVAVPLAFYCRNAWTLVISTVAAAAGELVLSYCIAPCRPRLELDWPKAREMMRFGKWILWSNGASYLSLYADSWVVGRVFGTASIGYYQMAQQIGMTPMAQIGGHISAVALPGFSKLDHASRRPAFLRAMRFVSTALLPPAALVTVFAAVLVRLVLGEKWAPVCPLLRLLIWGGVLTALTGLSTAFLQALNRPDLSARALFLKVLGFALLIYPLMRVFGISGAALAALLSCPIGFCYQYAKVARELGWGSDLLLVFRPAMIACAPALAAAILLPFSASVWATILIAVLAGACSLVIVVRELRAFLQPGLRPRMLGDEQDAPRSRTVSQR